MGRALALEYVKYGCPGMVLVGTGIAPPDPTRYTPPRVHPSYRTWVLPGMVTVPRGHAGQLNSAVGLKSVDQLTLGRHFSGLRTMTEVYNLLTVGNR